MSGAFLIDTEITHTFIRGAIPIDSVDKNSEVTVTISVNGHSIAHGSVPLAASAHSIPFSLESLEPQKKPYSVLCIATAEDGRTFRTTSSILRLPDPKSGSVTKMDLRTGALLVKKSNKWESIFPIGFYTNFGGYLAKDLDILDDLKERGCVSIIFCLLGPKKFCAGSILFILYQLSTTLAPLSVSSSEWRN